MPGGDECGIVVRNHGRGAGRQPVKRMVRIGCQAAQVKSISDAQRFEAAGGFRNAFQDEAMEAVARIWIRAGQPFVVEHRQTQFVGESYGEIERLVDFRPPVHLAPVEYIVAAGADGG